jgi:hypothetical protein
MIKTSKGNGMITYMMIQMDKESELNDPKRKCKVCMHYMSVEDKCIKHNSCFLWR